MWAARLCIPVGTGGGGMARTGRPQAAQNCAESSTCLPHPWQNTIHLSDSVHETTGGSECQLPHTNSGEELTHLTELLVASLQKLLRIETRKLVEGAREHGIEQLRRGRVVVVGAAIRLGNDFVDQLEPQEIWRGNLQRFRSDFSLARVAPHDRGASFR